MDHKDQTKYGTCFYAFQFPPFITSNFTEEVVVALLFYALLQ